MVTHKQVYTIVISEAQRARLVEILQAANLPTEDETTMVDQNFLGCLVDLPTEEQLNPCISHGLCY